MRLTRKRLSQDGTGWLTALPLSVVVVIGALLSIRSHYLLRHDRELVDHSFEVIRAADQVLIGSLDAETGQRGFVITADLVMDVADRDLAHVR